MLRLNDNEPATGHRLRVLYLFMLSGSVLGLFSVNAVKIGVFFGTIQAQGDNQMAGYAQVGVPGKG